MDTKLEIIKIKATLAIRHLLCITFLTIIVQHAWMYVMCCCLFDVVIIFAKCGIKQSLLSTTDYILIVK